MTSKRGVFLVWKEYQRRVEVLAPLLGLDIYYFTYSWESTSRLFKALSYLPKSVNTLRCLFRNRPVLVFVQFPPVPALYCVALYSWLTGVKYVSDCHMGITNAHWLTWPLAKRLLATGTVIVHNEHLVGQVRASTDVNPFVLRDGVAQQRSMSTGETALLTKLGLSPKTYVIFPCSYSPDEPVQEVIEAARLLPAIPFVMTWHSARLSRRMRATLPSNVLLTGYLETAAYDCLFANSGAALALTAYEGVQLSAMQEAMAFAVPAVVSDHRTTRFLYKDYPVFVKNEPTSIASGVAQALRDRVRLGEGMKRLRTESENEFYDQVRRLRTLLHM